MESDTGRDLFFEDMDRQIYDDINVYIYIEECLYRFI